MSRGFNRLLESVVSINVRELAFESGARRYTSSLGSGVLMSEDGIVLTNAHVVSRRAVEINVTLSNLERVGARLVGWDHWTDLAVLRLDLEEVKRPWGIFKVDIATMAGVETALSWILYHNQKLKNELKYHEQHSLQP